MSKRIDLFHTEPDAYKAIMVLENYVVNSGISKKHLELIKIRASQINGCAYCLDMHTRDARKAGETEQRIYVLNAWRDTSFFKKKKKPYWPLPKKLPG